MKILALERELSNASAVDFQRLAKYEALAVWELHQAGLIRELYFRADQTTAVLMLECASIEEASTSLAPLPYVREGLISFDLIPLTPYSGFERLFAQIEDE
jgi:hypothetical protein